MSKKIAPQFEGEEVLMLKAVPGLKIFVSKPKYQSVVRWTTKGCNGIKLESRREGGKRYTSKEAVQRFLEQQNQETT